jgi:acetyl esterase/lipase
MNVCVWVSALIFGSCGAVVAEPKPELLWPDGANDSNGLQGPEVMKACIGNISTPTLTFYPAPEDTATGAAVMLKYRLPNQHHLIPANDARRAIRMTRARAAEWEIDPKRVGVWGFSAGGHLASTVATVFDAGDEKSADPVEGMSSRPDFAILFYPVISMKEEITHKGSRENLMGHEDLIERCSNELRVTAETPPCFLLHCSDDTSVPVDNSLRFYQALVANKIPSDRLIFEEGKHGPGAFKKNPSWEAALDGWLKKRGCLK